MIIVPRRKLLLAPFAGLLGALPASALRELPEARAAALPGLTRLVVFVSGGWFPQECYLGKDGGPGPSLAPLLPYKDSMTLVEGLDNRVADANKRSDDAHYNVGKYELTGGGPTSIDQIVSARLAAPTVLSTLNLALTPEKNRYIKRDGNTLAGELNPTRVFDQLFAGLEPSEPNQPNERDRRNALRKHALDQALRSADRVKGQLSGARRSQLEAFAAGATEQLQAIERSGALPVPGCVSPEMPGVTGLANMDSSLKDDTIYPATVEAHIRNITAALLCDLTRVATLQFSNDDNHPKTHFKFVPGITTSYKKNDHDVSHDAHTGDPEAMRRKLLYHEWLSEQIAVLLKTLAAVPEGDGTMLDHTLVTWIPSWGTGSRAHTLANVPAVLIGGRKPTGYRHRQYDNQPSLNDFWGGIQQAFGVEQDKFGDPQFSDGALTDLWT